ncbi:MAG: polyprenyl synthetase family protein [Myxococcales bacterium]|nr:polyprenyl synthetase family protein [Myxococcales bacterium]
MSGGGFGAEELAQAVREALARLGLPAATLERLVVHATRHLPIAGREEGSPFIPPMYTLRVAEALGLAPTLGQAAAAAGCLLFAAADLADDCADGDVRTSMGVDVNDACFLLFAAQHAVLALPVGAEEARWAGRLFAEAGARMAIGQEADLRGTDAREAADPLAIARGKSGGELAVFFGLPARLAGRDPAPWLRFGEAFGALVQVLTDYFDLFLDPTSDDWEAAKPTLPLRRGLAHPRHGLELSRLLAGDRAGHDRKARGLWLLVQAGAAEGLAEAVRLLDGEMAAATEAAGGSAALDDARAELVDWCGGVVEALAEYGGDAAPPADDPAMELAACREAAARFLGTDPALEGVVEVHRSGLFGQPEVRGGVFERAIALQALAGEGLPVQAARTAAFSLADDDGWRYFPGHRELPVDGDCVGVMMQLAAGSPDAAHPAMDQGEALLLRADNQDDDGLFQTWLADPPACTRAEIDATWAGEVCPGAAANALLGLWRHAPTRLDGVVAPRALALARRLAGEEAPASVFYRPVGVDYMGARALLALRAERPGDAAFTAALDAALRAIGDRLRGRLRLSGRLGDVLETAMGGYVLARLQRLPERASVRRALVDAQEADGGYPADPFYRTVPHPVTTWYGSRGLTTALVLQALRWLEG